MATSTATKAGRKPRKSTAKRPASTTAKKAPAKTKPASTKKAASKKSTGKRSYVLHVDSRRGRGNLALDVAEVIGRFEKGKVKLPEGKTLTPHRISAEILASEEGSIAPSAGAITNVLRDMASIGYITLHKKPVAVKQVTAAGKAEGYAQLKDKAREKAKASKATKKAA